MATNNNAKASPEATREAETMWHWFVFAFKACGAVAAIVLILMAIFLA